MTAKGGTASLTQITDEFEALYQGTATTRGLFELESLLAPIGLLQELNRRVPNGMGIVTGRPRKDCDTFLQNHG